MPTKSVFALTAFLAVTASVPSAAVLPIAKGPVTTTVGYPSSTTLSWLESNGWSCSLFVSSGGAAAFICEKIHAPEYICVSERPCVPASTITSSGNLLPNFPNLGIGPGGLE